MIYINDKEHLIDISKTLAEVFTFLNIDADKGIAVAVNEVVIPKINWNNFILKENDKVLLIKATQGG